MKLSEFNIGFADGKREANEIPEFYKYYYDGLGIYDRIEIRNKYVITGRKGSGKTLFAYYYCAMKQKLNNIGIYEVESLKDVTIEAINKFKEQLSADNSILMWRWVLLICYAKWLLQDQCLEHDEEYIKSIYKIISTEVKYGLNIAGHQLGYENSVKEQSIIDKFESILFSFERSLINVASQSQMEVRLFMDDLDEKYINNDQYLDSVRDILSAAEVVNNLFIERGVNSKFIILLRSDIVKKLRGVNIGKIKRDCTVEIDWTTKISFDTPVLKMLISKIRNSVDSMRRMSDHTVFNAIFSEFTNGEQTYKYILNRTMLRPRDLISFISIIIENNKNSDKITQQMIYDAERQYGEYLKEEVYNELFGTYTQKYIDSLFKLLKLNRQSDFSFPRIRAVYDEYKSNLEIGDLNEALEVLFEYSIIGNIVDGNSSPIYSFRYRDLDAPFAQNEQITIHPGLRREINR